MKAWVLGVTFHPFNEPLSLQMESFMAWPSERGSVVRNVISQSWEGSLFYSIPRNRWFRPRFGGAAHEVRR
jgi:hypothetical protein